jgi:hypothetical protein
MAGGALLTAAGMGAAVVDITGAALSAGASAPAEVVRSCRAAGSLPGAGRAVLSSATPQV